MGATVSADSFADAVEEILNQYGEDAFKALQDVVPKAANRCAKTIRANSRKKSGRYAKGWTKRQEPSGRASKGVSYTVYNRDRYRVAHLLEKGHVIKNAKGTYGMTSGDGVVAAAEEDAEQFLIEEMERKLDK